MKSKVFSAWLLLGLPVAAPLAAGTTTAAAVPETGEELIREMHERYNGKWYRNLTFVQQTTFANGSSQTWHEALALPGRLRIDIEENGVSLLFRNDSLYQFQGGSLAGSQPQQHPLLILGFDVYHQPPAATVEALRNIGFDLSKLREGEWQGRPVWVVGADEGDESTAQFWIDQEHLYFVRMLSPSPQNPDVVSEIQFNKYQRLGEGWIAPEVVFLAGGQQRMLEVYHDMKIGMDLADEIFSVDPFTDRALIPEGDD